MFKKISQLSLPLVVALAAIIAVYFVLPAGVTAGEVAPPDDVSLLDSVLPALPPSFDENTIRISLSSGRLPEIAVNDIYAAVVYAENVGTNKSVYLISGDSNDTGWNRTLLDSGTGENTMVPKVALSGTNQAHVVWNSDDGQTIHHRACTLARGKSPQCGETSNIFSNSAESSLRPPDIAIDGDTVHVAWFDSGSDKIRTAYATNVVTDTAPSWTTTQINLDFSDYDNEGSIALAVGASNLHLALKAFYDDPVELDPDYWEVLYYQLSKVHDQNPTSSYNSANRSAVINDIYNTTIAVAGNKVYLAWDAHKSTDKFNLLSVQSLDEGATWENTGQPQYITSTNNIGAGVDSDDRQSESTGVPSEELALRPSLAATGITSTQFAIVWQETPGVIGSGEQVTTNCTSEVYYASPQSDWSSNGQVDNNTDQYSIDPDLAFDSSGDGHVVFMMAETDSCAGAEFASEYYITYRGPYGGTFEAGGVFLPIIIK